MGTEAWVELMLIWGFAVFVTLVDTATWKKSIKK